MDIVDVQSVGERNVFLLTPVMSAGRGRPVSGTGTSLAGHMLLGRPGELLLRPLRLWPVPAPVPGLQPSSPYLGLDPPRLGRVVR